MTISNQFQIGCQVIIFGQRNQEDIEGCIKAVAAAGYAGLENGPVTGNVDIETYKGWLKQYNLAQAGVHMGFPAIDRLSDFIQYCKQTGSRYLMVSGVGDYKTEGLEAYKKAAPLFNEVGRKCREEGIDFCYHNHAWEFQQYDGVTALDWLYQHTDPDLVKLCPDVYWIQVGGQDPATFLRKHADRIAYIHLKDGYPGDFREIGQGPLDWNAIWDALQQLKHVEWLTVEQDRTTRNPEESIAMSRKFIREHFGI